MIERCKLIEAVETAIRRSPITAILGPRQCGKTTAARRVCASRQDATFYDLEEPAALDGFRNPMTLLRDLNGLIVIDEIQRMPDLFPVLRVLADRESSSSRFLILGSASPQMLRQASESLAGRVEFIEMSGFGLDEVGVESIQSLWRRGGFPRSFLAQSEPDSLAWREQFIRTFLERDIPQMGLNIPALTLRRFWTMAAHYHGQTWNSSEVAGSMGIDDHTSRRYLDLLAGAYMVRLLPPWHENIGKRQRKAPKVYFRDAGLLHSLLGITGRETLMTHPKVGASWEGFAVEQILRMVPSRDVYYWAVHNGPEMDLLIFHEGRRIGFEFKFGDTPSLARSMRQAHEYLNLDILWVVYPGTRRYPLADKIEALPLTCCLDAAALTPQ